MGFGAHGKSYDGRTNRYMAKFYGCFFGGVFVGLTVDYWLGGAISAYGLYNAIVYIFTDRD
ncbi:hypothetical protein ATY37_20020 [Vibrio cidicii]|uniref:Uncharacterized protein n=1 Tax=Vibrio cidicii TaxID=1763883 RepID=A0A151KV53_9VIBR|nr:hypothetical protein [Vibrio cidicii]KYN85001.1 hypothetical protein ATY37_20020 [Vibrio cidicii]MBG0761895.1 hypothetical protein [Vibrio cidicii]TLE07481.1 hypothetical protein D2B32_18855 [Vibrio cholerae]TLE12893.1 hypothetical protein D2923_18810 [Vibrio cholerae]